MCAMVVCLTTTWLVMSGVRYIFEADLTVLSDDTTLFQFLYQTPPPAAAAAAGAGAATATSHTSVPTTGERYVMRNWGCALLAKGVLDLCVTFGGSPKFTFTMLALFNVLVVWSAVASILSGELPFSFNSEIVLTFLLMLEAPCFYQLGETNGVAEDEDEHHD